MICSLQKAYKYVVDGIKPISKNCQDCQLFIKRDTHKKNTYKETKMPLHHKKETRMQMMVKIVEAIIRQDAKATYSEVSQVK